MAHSCQNAVKWFAFLIELFQLSLSVLIIVLVRFSLHGSAGEKVDSCQLAPVQDWQEACTYADIVASISILFTFMTFLLQLYITHKEINSTSTSNSSSGQSFGVAAGRNICDKLTYALHLAVLVLAACWWAAAAVVLTHYGVRADNVSLPQGGPRVAVIVSCWVSMAVFLAVLAVELWQQAAARAMQPVTITPRTTGNRAQEGNPGYHLHNTNLFLRAPPSRVHVGGVVYGVPVNPSLHLPLSAHSSFRQRTDGIPANHLLQLSAPLSTTAPDSMHTQQQGHGMGQPSTPGRQQDAGSAQHSLSKAPATVDNVSGLRAYGSDTISTTSAGASGPPSLSVTPLHPAASTPSAGHTPCPPGAVQQATMIAAGAPPRSSDLQASGLVASGVELQGPAAASLEMQDADSSPQHRHALAASARLEGGS